MKLGRRVESQISQQLKKRTGYAYHALLVNIGPEVRLLIHTEDKNAEEYKRENVESFNSILYIMTGKIWVRKANEENWILLNKKTVS